MRVPEQVILRASQWCYRGVWRFVTDWLDVPEQPPTFTGADDTRIQSFRPAEGYLRYLKLFFWIGLTLFDGVLFVGWIVLLVSFPIAGILLAAPIWAIMILPDIVAYIAIHLRYDTTWYVLSDRSMRIRRGIWLIHETTITYENIQNVSIRQGPVQRYFGISDVLVETAGGGTGAHGEQVTLSHAGRLEGVGNPSEIRDLILSKWQAAKSAGLGDELQAPHASSPIPVATLDSESDVRLLEEIRDLAVALAQE